MQRVCAVAPRCIDIVIGIGSGGGILLPVPDIFRASHLCLAVVGTIQNSQIQRQYAVASHLVQVIVSRRIS